MTKIRRLRDAVAPMALVGLVLLPAAMVCAADTTTPRPVPKIRVPTTPVQLETTPRILKRVPVSDDKTAKPDEERVKVDAAEASPAPENRVRTRTPRVDTGIPVETGTVPRIRTRVVTTTEQVDAEAAPPPARSRIGTQRINTSETSQIEITPRIRTRVPALLEIENTPNAPERKARTQADGSSSLEEAHPRSRTPKIFDIPAEIDPSAPKRKRVPVAGENDIDGPIVSPGTNHIPKSDLADVIQATCVLPDSMTKPPTSLSVGPKGGSKSGNKEGGGTSLMELVCMMGGKPTPMTFRYDDPKNIMDLDSLSAAKQNHYSGFASIARYEKKSFESGSNGKPIYRMLAVVEGPQSLQKVACTANGRDNDNSLSVGPRDPQEGPTYTTWCGDGTKVFPVSFKLNSLISSGNSAVHGSNTSANKAFAYVEYESVTSNNESGPFLVRKISPSLPYESYEKDALPNLMEAKFNSCSSTGISFNAAACTEDGDWDKSGNSERYHSFIPPNLRLALGPTVDDSCETFKAPVYDDNSTVVPGGANIRHDKYMRYYDYERVTCTYNSMFIRLLPGVIPTKHRPQAEGACYVGMIGNRSKKVESNISFSRKVLMVRTDGGMLVEMDPGGEGSGVGTTYKVVAAPC